MVDSAIALHGRWKAIFGHRRPGLEWLGPINLEPGLECNVMQISSFKDEECDRGHLTSINERS